MQNFTLMSQTLWHTGFWWPTCGFRGFHEVIGTRTNWTLGSYILLFLSKMPKVFSNGRYRRLAPLFILYTEPASSIHILSPITLSPFFSMIQQKRFEQSKESLYLVPQRVMEESKNCKMDLLPRNVRPSRRSITPITFTIPRQRSVWQRHSYTIRKLSVVYWSSSGAMV